MSKKIKFFTLFLALLMVLSTFAACGGGSDTDAKTDADPAETEDDATETLYPAENADNCDAAEILIGSRPLPEFSADKTEYWRTVTKAKGLPTVEATAFEPAATVSTQVTDEKALITITSANGEKERTYTVNFIETATFDKFDLDTYLIPFWEGNVVYNETIMFVGETEAPLLYKPTKVLSVRSYDLKTEYVEGKDYLVEQGKIVLLEGTRIPSFTLEEFYPASPNLSLAQTQLCNVAGHPYILFSEGSFFFKHQIQVTYVHEEEWSGFTPEKSEKLYNFTDRAEAGEELNIVFFGDSITTGNNASGKANCAPYTDIWPVMVTNALRQKYPDAKINYINTAVGGKETNWALENLAESVNAKDPDLVILGFGMNDGGKTPAAFQANMKKLVDGILAAHPDCEIAMIATMLPHFRLTNFYKNQYLFEETLYELAESYDNVDVIPMTSVHTSLLEHKRYYDMTGNNVNHPSDFLIRIYAQTILKVLVG